MDNCLIFYSLIKSDFKYMSLIEIAGKFSPKGYQPTQEEVEADSLFKKIRLDCEEILAQHGTRIPHKMIRLTPFPYAGALAYRLTPWQVCDGVKLTTILGNSEDEGERLTITLESPYVSDPKKAPSLILRVEESGTYLVLLKDSAIIRDKNRTVREANIEDAEIYQEVIDALRPLLPTPGVNKRNFLNS